MIFQHRNDDSYNAWNPFTPTSHKMKSIENFENLKHVQLSEKFLVTPINRKNNDNLKSVQQLVGNIFGGFSHSVESMKSKPFLTFSFLILHFLDGGSDFLLWFVLVGEFLSFAQTELNEKAVIAQYYTNVCITA